MSDHTAEIISELNNQRLQDRQKLTKAHKELSDAQNAFRQLKASSEQEIGRLRYELEQAADNLKEEKQKQVSLRNQLERQAAGFKSDAENLQLEMQALKQQHAARLSELKEQNAQLERAAKSRQADQQKMAELEKQWQMERERAESVSQQLNHAQELLTFHEHTVSALQEEVSQSSAKIKQLNSQLEASSQRERELKSTTDDTLGVLKNELQQLQITLANQQQEHAKKINDLTDHYQRLLSDANLSGLQRDLAEARAQVLSLTEDLKTERNRQQTTLQQALEQQRKDLEGQLQSAQATHREELLKREAEHQRTLYTLKSEHHDKLLSERTTRMTLEQQLASTQQQLRTAQQSAQQEGQLVQLAVLDKLRADHREELSRLQAEHERHVAKIRQQLTSEYENQLATWQQSSRDEMAKLIAATDAMQAAHRKDLLELELKQSQAGVETRGNVASFDEVESFEPQDNFTALFWYDISQPPFLQPDEAAENCTLCLCEFGVFNRRHHCRSCGFLFCQSCSSGRASVVWQSQTSKQKDRVCDMCALKIKYFHIIKGLLPTNR